MSKMLLHELHPSVVHAPLALLPTATVADLIALSTGDRAWERVGRRFWVAGSLSALFAGVAGLAASQQVRMREPHARDMVFLHGAGNALITLGALGVALWRQANRPSAAQCALAAGAVGAALYTATLGGKMVYELGVGINAMPADQAQGTLKGPALLSPEAPAALVRDAAAGVRWLLGRVRTLVSGAQPLARGAEGVREPDSSARILGPSDTGAQPSARSPESYPGLGLS
jgi:uncharacterized membrane protein